MKGAGDDEHDVVDHVAVRAVVQELAQRLISLRGSVLAHMTTLRDGASCFLLAELERIPAQGVSSTIGMPCATGSLQCPSFMMLRWATAKHNMEF